MLKDILKSIKNDGYISKSMLAKEFKTSEEVIEGAIEQLVRMGYIVKEETGQGYATACASCPFAKTCNKEIVNIFKVSDKAGNIN